MAESFENLDNILRDWAKDKLHKSLAEALNRFEKLTTHKIGLGKPRAIGLSRI